MACSPAQLESNRRNSLRSTGPRTPDGKSKSRANGLKHGLTGAGIVLPGEDAEEVDRRFATLEAEMKPRSGGALELVKRVALMTVRLDRSAEHEAKAISHRMRHAAAEFAEARLAEAERLYAWIASEPATNARRLRKSPEGIDLLLKAIEGLRADLDHPEGVRWGFQHCDQLHHLLGRRRADVPVSRPRALTEAMAGDFKHLSQADRPDLEGLDRQCWAAAALLGLIEGEIAALRALHEDFDHEALELDRSEAAARAVFDAAPAATLARKYEAATERGLYRALREFRRLQAEIPEAEAAPKLAAEPAEGLGSSSPDHPDETSEESNADPIEPGVVLAGIDGDDEAPEEGSMADSGRSSGRQRPVREPSSGR